MQLTKPVKTPRQHEGAKALRFGVDENGRSGAWLTCQVCGKAEGARVEVDAPPIAIDQVFAQRLGWSVVGQGRKATCPKCQGRAKAPEATPAQQRQIFRLLEEHLKVERNFGEYSPGWSDARIAEAAEVPEVLVMEARRSGFAPHLADRAREELLGQLRELEISCEREMKELRDLIGATQSQFSTEFARLRGLLAARGAA